MPPDKASKTEKPTPRRLKEARREGNIARSQELAPWLSILALTFVAPLAMSMAGRRMDDLWRRMGDVIAHPEPQSAVHLLFQSMLDMAVMAAPIIATTVALGLIVGTGQVGFSMAMVRLKPKFERVNPFKGFKRLFSANTLWEAAKQLAKFSVLTVFVVRGMMTTAANLSDVGRLSVPAAVSIIGRDVLSLIRSVALVALVLAGADYLWQRRRMGRQLMMSVSEVKQEHRQYEGSPFVRSAIRSRQLSMSRNRMISEVAQSDVVVVNPTHYAVALGYDAARGAPRVIAKGAGHVAARIREKAEEHGVPVVQDVLLTRTLHAACKVGQEIPPELYDAVARLLAFIFALRSRGMAAGFHGLARSTMDSPVVTPSR